MSEVKIKQGQYESDTLKRVLSFMMDENIHLKNRLLEVLKEKSDKNLLEEVKSFQNRFIKKDAQIGFLRSDLAELDKLLERGMSEGKIINEKETDRSLKKLRIKIITVEIQFSNLKLEFNSYLSENM